MGTSSSNVSISSIQVPPADVIFLAVLTGMHESAAIPR
jgi:hypothetical protein